MPAGVNIQLLESVGSKLSYKYFGRFDALTITTLSIDQHPLDGAVEFSENIISTRSCFASVGTEITCVTLGWLWKGILQKSMFLLKTDCIVFWGIQKQ